MSDRSILRSRWAAIGATVAVTLGAGGIGLVAATGPSGATAYVSVTPCRVIDTRPESNIGPRDTPLADNDTHTVIAHGNNGNCSGIPMSATAVAMNVTAVGASAPTFLTIWAADASRPLASSLNPRPGQTNPNAVTTDLSSNGKFKIYNRAGSVHVIADIVGYYVDHHHDDRYYTRKEIDTAKSVSLDPTGWYVEDGGYDQTGSTQHTGLFLNDEVFASTMFSVTLPADLTIGTELRFDIYWHINENGCSAVMDLNFVQGTRVGFSIISVSSEIIPPAVVGISGIGAVRKLTVKASAPNAGGFRPRDVVKVGIFRDTDSCTDPVIVDGATMTYG